MPDEQNNVTPEERRTPVHPVEPNPLGSAPEPESVPTGPDGEDIKYVTDDIGPDGQPNVTARFVAPSPQIDGESGAERPDANPNVDQAAPEVKSSAPTPEGVELQRIKEAREVELNRPQDDPDADVTRTIEGNPTQPLQRTRDEGAAEGDAHVETVRKANEQARAARDDGKAERQQENLKAVEDARAEAMLRRPEMQALVRKIKGEQKPSTPAPEPQAEAKPERKRK